MPPSILLVSSDFGPWHYFAEALKKELPVEFISADNGAQALQIAREKILSAAIIDAVLPDMTGLTLVKALMEVNAMINIALVSAKPADQYHAETEGLGIMLQLPPNPLADQAGLFAQRLREVGTTF